ncbi:MAG TPA: carboxypeptidase-like regulatory domain-containing protein, partial [Candidatus Acidoferrum sp.]|nr:carboxypeptidase-like regulatory domain-containing protein [Candidatus Acidoferrum sp.]
MSRRAIKPVCILALMLLLAVSHAFAQQLATLNVTVNDQSGAGVPGANITLKNKDTAASRTATTGEGGLAVVAGLPAGLYDLTAEHAGLSPRTLPVQLAVGQVATLTVSLTITARAEKVEVTETVQGVDPEKAEVSQVIDTPKIQDLPISGRDFIDFVLLTPSVNVGRSTAVGAQSPFTETVLKLSFAGVRESHTSFFSLDGIDYTTSISGVQRISPSQDWVQEFRVVPSPYSGDNGRNLGSVVNTVTKSGTNDVHGSVYEFFRNNNLDAKNLLSAPGFNTLRFNQFGATVGGPIRKDKIFFFGGYEGQRRAESPIYSSFILNCTAGVNCFGPGTPSINTVKTLLGLGTENLGSIVTVQDYDKLIVKTNIVLSDKTFINEAYLFNDSRKKNVRGAAPGEGLPSSYRDNPVRDQTLYGSLIHLFSPKLTSETLLQYGRRKFDLIPKGEGFEPALSIPDLMSSGGFV